MLYVIFAGANSASAAITLLISTGEMLLELQVNGSFSAVFLFEQFIKKNIQRILSCLILSLS